MGGLSPADHLCFGHQAWELEQTGGVFTEQVVRPTGLIDPVCEVRPTETQVDDIANAAPPLRLVHAFWSLL